MGLGAKTPAALLLAREWRRYKRSRGAKAPPLRNRKIENVKRLERMMANNDRIAPDPRDKANQAHGKMRRAGVYATRKRG